MARRLLLRFAEALHRAGIPAHRLEGVMALLAAHLGVEARVFGMPTAVFAAIGPEQASQTELLRIAPSVPDLGSQAELDEIVEEMLAHRLDPTGALSRLAHLANRPSPWPRWATIGAFAGTGAFATVVLGGGAHEAATGAVAGTLVGVLDRLAQRRPGLANLLEPLATFVAMGLATVVHHLVAPIDVVSTTLGAVIVLLPGLALTTGITELATRNLVSGTARLAGAGVVFVGMAVGAAVAIPLGTLLPEPPALVPLPLPPRVRWVALPLVGLTLAVLLRARPRDIGWVAVAPVLAVGLAAVAEPHLGPIVGVGAASFGLALISNGLARWRHRPSSTLLVPGILLLVPGSAGLRAILRLAEHDTLAGVDGFFAAVLVATSLAAGVLMASLVLAPRRGL